MSNVPIRERLKSFVLRKGRITSNQKKALIDLKDHYLLNEDSKIELFNGTSVALDIGFGAGETTIHLAKTNPELSVIGVEVYLSGIGSVLSRAYTEGIENLRIFNGDVVPFMEEKVPDNSLDLVLMFYPDPWPKRKHHKRRLFQQDFLSLISKKLKQGSIFYFKTDWEDYFRDAQKIVQISDGWKEQKREDLANYLKCLPQTSFEKKALSAERDLKEIILKKIS